MCWRLSVRLVTSFASHDFRYGMPNYHSSLLCVLLRKGRCDTYLQSRPYGPTAAFLRSNGMGEWPRLQPRDQDAVRKRLVQRSEKKILYHCSGR